MEVSFSIRRVITLAEWSFISSQDVRGEERTEGSAPREPLTDLRLQYRKAEQKAEAPSLDNTSS